MSDRINISRKNEGYAFSYDIVWQDDFDSLPGELQQADLHPGKICIVTDSNVASLYMDVVKKAVQGENIYLTEFIIPAGEENKKLEIIMQLYQQLIEEHFERKDMLIALGGGVVGDMTGFAAATYLRGIPFVQVPTTLLSQVDSSVGGKTGVDFQQFKNMIGAFYQPRLVYMNVSVLKTLPQEQFVSGMGEVLKTGLIRDAGFYRWLLEKRDSVKAMDKAALTHMIRRCCEIKAAVVEEDPTEKGVRAILNFGHTLGHAVEKSLDFRMLHGQCVGAGMIAAARLSFQKGYLSEQDLEEIRSGNLCYGLPVTVKGYGLTADTVLKASKSDKKMEAGHVKFVLLRQIGEAVIDHSITDEELTQAAEEIL